MTFADQYATHTYADLVREAETQGIGIGAEQERERILALLEAHVSDLDLEWFEMKWSDMVALIRGENK